MHSSVRIGCVSTLKNGSFVAARGSSLHSIYLALAKVFVYTDQNFEGWLCTENLPQLTNKGQNNAILLRCILAYAWIFDAINLTLNGYDVALRIRSFPFRMPLIP